MTRFLRSKRSVSVLAATAVGSGSGAVEMGTAPAVALSSDTVGPMFPGQTKTVTVHVQNTSPGDLHVGQIGGSVETDDNGTPSDPSDDCDGSWFTVAPIAAQTVPANSTVDSTTSLTMAETGASQDGCQRKSLTVDWSTGGGATAGGTPAHLAGLSSRLVQSPSGGEQGLYEVTVTLSGTAAADTQFELRALGYDSTGAFASNGGVLSATIPLLGGSLQSLADGSRIIAVPTIPAGQSLLTFYVEASQPNQADVVLTVVGAGGESFTTTLSLFP
jgi:hypothetical protein